ncbi:phospho-N-acetylmuramoyl-pentapeptide-transferase homolog isoform X2 [Durio zibethinus]|uniref:Phospho-N-acetylmuramoyl-pentapeptide- transferase homolog isoform X2 n=1 Tax=Durio zibethinus TaxID=66656 RepID=A0A6P5X4H1_DURZI|nr:phospho-N-acetylmuramoyl-pentapeptide-transferase homolog isoform X2 [Durio zibethinus]
MRSRFSSSNLHHFSSSGLSRSPKRLTSVPVLSRVPFLSSPQFRGAAVSNFYSPLKLQSKRSKNVQKRRRRFPHDVVRVNATDDDSVGISSFDDWVVDDSVAAYMFSSSSEGEGSDGEIVLSPLSEVDLPPIEVSTDEAVTVTAHRLASIGRGQKRHRIYHGLLINLALIIFLTMVLLLVDWCGWKIVRLPLAPFYLTSPFFMSLILASCAGYICVPLLKTLKFRQILRKEGPARHSRKKKTPKMGGLFFIPAGISVAKFLTGFSSIEVSAAAAATLAFAAIGLLDDVLSFIKQHNSGLSPCFRLLLEAAVGIWFSFWLDATTLTSPYGKYDLDGLAGGTAALAFIGLSIAVLPICPELAIFGASMAGACVGFLLHNQYKASVFMGNTGSLALGGALASMAACTGMFFPLFISSGFFVLEALSAMMQVLYFKTTKHLRGSGRRLFRMAPFHHHLELCGHKEPMIVAGAYVVSCVLALFAGYVGLMSA